MQVDIREATPEDAERIVGILNPIIDARVYTAFDTPFTPEFEREYILAFPARGIFHVAVDPSENRVVGFQCMEPFAAYMRAFNHVGVLGTYVDLAWRRLGIASQMFQALFPVARRKGYEKIFTFVRADNEAALQTYIRQGFRIVGTAYQHAKVDGRHVDEIVIERLLSS
jgi:L-amino acid N-acyltransferase YncA